MSNAEISSAPGSPAVYLRTAVPPVIINANAAASARYGFRTSIRDGARLPDGISDNLA